MASTTNSSEEAFRAFDIATAGDEIAAAVAVRRFLFAHDFDSSAPSKKKEAPSVDVDAQTEVTDAPPPPPPPLFTEEDLVSAREEARVLGHAQGLKDAEDSAMHFQVLALEAIADQLAASRVAQDAANAETHRMAAALAVAVVKKLLPVYVREHGVAEVEALVAACLPHLLNEPRLILRVAPENVEAVRDRVEPLARDRGFEGSVVIMEDADIGPADCRLEWNDGGAERDVETLFQRIQDIVARNSDRAPAADAPAAAPPETE
jgi:flagellar assembly protein FliH